MMLLKKHVPLFALVALLVVSGCTADNDGDQPVNYQDRYIGEWDCEEVTGINAPQFYTVLIEEGSTEEEIIIKNLYSSDSRLQASISGLSLSIPTQVSQNITFDGSGSANADFGHIELNFSADDGGTTDQVRAILRPAD